jgi:acetyl esterase
MMFGTDLDLERLHPEIRASFEAFSGGASQDFGRTTALELREIVKMMPYPDPGCGPIGSVSWAQVPVEPGTIPCKVYRPREEREPGRESSSRLPLMLFMHGGGWVSCDVETHDQLCRTLCAITHSIVVSVEYRRAPEHPFPTPLHDAFEALRWMDQHAEMLGGDRDKIIVAGDSAGGNLAAGISIMARESGGPEIAMQLLLYAAFRWEDWYVEGYLKDAEDAQNPLVSPIYLEDVSGLPPAVFLLPEFDGLTDQALLYSEKLSEAGVGVTVHEYPGAIHGFLTTHGHTSVGQQAFQDIASAVSRITGANP